MTLSVNGTSPLTSNQSPEAIDLNKWIVTEGHALQANSTYVESKKIPCREKNFKNTEISYICSMIADTDTLDKYNKAREKLEQIHDGCRQVEINNNSNNEKKPNILIDIQTDVILNEVNISEKLRSSKEEISPNNWQRNQSENTAENVAAGREV